jgi:transposase
MPKLVQRALRDPDGIGIQLAEGLELCQRMHATATHEQERIDATLHQVARETEAVQRLLTIPAVGVQVALTIYAWVGDPSRFRSARELASYAGLVPSVRQSGSTSTLGQITRMGSPQLRTVLVQAGHVLLWRCQSEQSAPLKALPQRVHTARGRRKIAVVAAARHILRIAYYVLRDGTCYDPARLRSATASQPPAAA